MTPRKVFGCLKLPKFVSKSFWFLLKIIIKTVNLFVLVLYFTKRRCSQIEPHFRVEIEDGREAP